MLSVVFVQSGQNRLDCQVSKAVSCRGEDVGDAGVNVRVVARVRAELPANRFIAHNVRQVVPEHEHLRDKQVS